LHIIAFDAAMIRATDVWMLKKYPSFARLLQKWANALR
jgi:hypothetical protein